MEKGARRPDPPAIAQPRCAPPWPMRPTQLPGLPLFAGGKSFGGRMTSQAQAAAPLPNVRGLVFVGFPLHPAGKPANERAQHLQQVALPMLFLQGTRDELADLGAAAAGDPAARRARHARAFDEADHAFHVPARSGRAMPTCAATCSTRRRAGSNGSSLLAPETGALAPSAATA